MAYESGALDATLAAAAGEDPALLNELRSAFIESANKQLDLLKRSRCDGNWNVAAMRLKGLAASFHAQDLLVAAEMRWPAPPANLPLSATLKRCLRALQETLWSLFGPDRRKCCDFVTPGA